MPSSHSTRRENARRSFAPRSCGTIAHSLRRENARRSFAPRSCGTIAHSLIFAPRRRLPPPLLSARHFLLKTHGITVGFLHLCLPLTLRVAKMQDVHSLLVFRSAAKLSLVHSFLLRGGGFRRFFKAIFAQKPAASPRVSCIYAFLSLCASRKYYFASRGECCYPRLPYGLSSPVQNKLPHSQNAGLTFSLYKNF